MANEVIIIDNPANTVVPGVTTVSESYQRQNTRAEAASNGIDNSYVYVSGSSVIVDISGGIDVNGVLYSVASAATLTPASNGLWYIALTGSGDTLTPALQSSKGTFDASKNGLYDSGIRVLNWLVYKTPSGLLVFRLNPHYFSAGQIYVSGNATFSSAVSISGNLAHYGSTATLNDTGSGGGRHLFTDSTHYIGNSRTADGAVALSLISDTTYTDHGLRLLRAGGADGSSIITHRGAGPLTISCPEDGFIYMDTPYVEVQGILNVQNAALLQTSGITLAVPTTANAGITIDNGLADGAELVLASEGYNNWYFDNISGRLRAVQESVGELWSIDAAGNMSIGGNIDISTSGAYLYNSALNSIGFVGLQLESSGAVTQDDLFNVLASYVPNVGDSIRLSGEFFCNSDGHTGANAAFRTSAATIEIYAGNKNGAPDSQTITSGSSDLTRYTLSI